MVDSLLLNCRDEFRVKFLQAKYLSLPSPTLVSFLIIIIIIIIIINFIYASNKIAVSH